MLDRTYPACLFCGKASEGLHFMSTTHSGQESPGPACRRCSDEDIDAMVRMNMIRSASFTTWAELEESSSPSLKMFLPAD